MLVGAVAEVLDGLTSVLGATEEQGVAASGGLEGELVKGEDLATSSLDPGTGGSSEAEGRDVDRGDLEETVVVGDGADDDDGALLVVLNVARNAREGDRGAVDAGHKEAAEDDLVEVRVRAACSEGGSVLVSDFARAKGDWASESEDLGTYGRGSGKASQGA